MQRNKNTVDVDPICGGRQQCDLAGEILQQSHYYGLRSSKIKLARHNCNIMACLIRLSLFSGTFSLQGIQGDMLVTSLLWGGPAYNQKSVVHPSNLFVDKILELGKKIAPKILLHLPKNMDKTEVYTLFSLIKYNFFIYVPTLIVYILNVSSVSSWLLSRSRC